MLRTSASGAAAQINSYDAFGVPGSGNSGRFQYTGQMWLPELGINYYKARMYSPVLGRFMQTDPIGYEDDSNLYGYIGNNPVNGVDRTGLQEEEPEKEAEIVVTGVPESEIEPAIVVTGDRLSLISEANRCDGMPCIWTTWPPKFDVPRFKNAVCGLVDFLPGDGANLGVRGGGGLGFLFVSSSNLRISDAG